MTKTIHDFEIKRVCVIDDDEEGRKGLELRVEDANLVAFVQEERVTALEKFFLEIVQPGDAVVSDHHLKKKNYFPVDGAELIYSCFNKNIPSVLVTKYEQSDIHEIRRFREKIPVILTPGEFDPETLQKSLGIFINELKGQKLPERKPWRTLIRIDDIVDHHLYILIPVWNPDEIISLSKKDLPKGTFEKLKIDMRVYAEVNIGANSANDLYFKNWEI